MSGHGPTPRDRGARLHRWGTWLSLACAVHCLATPLLVGLAPVLGLNLLTDPAVEIALLVGVGVVVLGSAYWELRRHRELRLVGWSVGAFGLILLGHLVGEQHWLGQAAVILGALGVAAAQFAGARLHTHSHPHPH